VGGTGRRPVTAAGPPGLVSADGRCVSAADRLHARIAIFAVGPDGNLTYVKGGVNAGGHPRGFASEPARRFPYRCNHPADHRTMFQVDGKAGGLALAGQPAPVGNPSCAVLLELKPGGLRFQPWITRSLTSLGGADVTLPATTGAGDVYPFAEYERVFAATETERK
jgi:hypothetical protein